MVVLAAAVAVFGELKNVLNRSSATKNKHSQMYLWVRPNSTCFIDVCCVIFVLIFVLAFYELCLCFYKLPISMRAYKVFFKVCKEVNLKNLVLYFLLQKSFLIVVYYSTKLLF